MGLIKPKKKLDPNLRKLWYIFFIIGFIMVGLSVYLLIFGAKADARFEDVVASKVKYYNHYVYTVDGEEYEYSERVSADKIAHKGDTATVRYLKSFPSVTFDMNMLVIGAMILGLGIVGIVFIKDAPKPYE